jgi:pimeloyl-ACP methyl ester carboxylesterase
MLDDVHRQDCRWTRTRIYLTGLSMGGYGAWKFAIAAPERFAAVAPVCGWGQLEDVEKAEGHAGLGLSRREGRRRSASSESEKMVRLPEEAFGSTKSVRYTLLSGRQS